MLVNYDGSRVKLSAEYASQEVENSTQGQTQPLNQQAKPVLPKNTQTAAGMQQAAPAVQPMTPIVKNPTLERMGIQMPQPKPATVTTSKLSKLAQSINNLQRQAAGLRPDYLTSHNIDPMLSQTLKRRDFYDSPYLASTQSADLKLRAPQGSKAKDYKNLVYGGTGAAVGAALPLMLRGLSPTSLLASAVLGGGGYLAGRMVAGEDTSRKLRDYRYHLKSQR
jgi:hypothetical protein